MQAPPPRQQQQDDKQAPACSGSSSGQQQHSSGSASTSQLPPTHKPLTHNPPSSPTKAPWASPATGSPFPQLAQPADNALGVISSSQKADRMSPTAAPWVAAAAAGPPSSQLLTGKPVQGELGWGFRGHMLVLLSRGC